MSHPADPTPATLKLLFALSNNQCAFRDPTGRLSACEQRIAEVGFRQVVADVCHIKGKQQGSARFDRSVSVEALRDFDNLILLCPTHHSIVDDVEPDRFTVKVLTEMKLKALKNAEPVERWGSPEMVQTAIAALQMRMDRLDRAGPLELVSMAQVGPMAVEGSGEMKANLSLSAQATVVDPPPTVTGRDLNTSGTDADSAGNHLGLPQVEAPVPGGFGTHSHGTGPYGSSTFGSAAKSSQEPGRSSSPAQSAPDLGAQASDSEHRQGGGGLATSPPGAPNLTSENSDQGRDQPSEPAEALSLMIRQIVGYDVADVMHLSPDGFFEVELRRPITDHYKRLLEGLAKERVVAMRFVSGDWVWIARP